MKKLPVLGFCGFSGAGKTTLLTKLIPALKDQGIRASVIKHAHHAFDIDQPSKDSYKLRQAGSAQMLIASSQRWALMTETPTMKREPDLKYLLTQIDSDLADIVLVEGFKHEAIPKIEVYRAALNRPLLSAEDPNIIAVASDTVLAIKQQQIDLNDIDAMVGFVQHWLKLSSTD
jgi:molybdopterin-guanine dinucleotide biosynthesis protein MobB